MRIFLCRTNTYLALQVNVTENNWILRDHMHRVCLINLIGPNWSAIYSEVHTSRGTNWNRVEKPHQTNARSRQRKIVDTNSFPSWTDIFADRCACKTRYGQCLKIWNLSCRKGTVSGRVSSSLPREDGNRWSAEASRFSTDRGMLHGRWCIRVTLLSELRTTFIPVVEWEGRRTLLIRWGYGCGMQAEWKG